MENQPEFETNWELTTNSFDELNLKQELLQGIYCYGFAKPSSIQSKSIRPILDRKDIIAQAQSCTGKTAAYLIPILQNIDTSVQQTQALILVPTRELALQAQKVLTSLAMFLQISVHLCTEGTPLDADEREKVRNGVQVIIGTPGRVTEMVKTGDLKFESLKILVLDEADERGVKDRMEDILKLVPKAVQIALFSTTLPFDTIRLARPFMKDPAIILVNDQDLVPEDIKQFYIAHEEEEQKFQTIMELYKIVSAPQQCVIFCNNHENVESLTLKLQAENISVSSIHGNMEPSHIDAALNEFLAGTHKVLITTDLLSRGIDMPQVSIVINYDLPITREDYIHRIGRCIRPGRKNVAFSLTASSDDKFIQNIETGYHTQVVELALPLNTSIIFE